MTRRSLAPIILALALTASPAAAQTVDATIAETAALAEMADWARKCEWSNPQAREAARLTIEEQNAHLAIAGVGLKANAAQLSAQSRARSGECAGPDAPAQRRKVEAALDSAFAVLALRAYAILAIEKSSPVTTDFTTLGPHKPQIDAVVAAIQRAVAPQMLQQTLDAQAQLSGAAMNLTCASRRNVRVKSPRACPAVPAADAVNIPYAQKIIASAEGMTPAFAKMAAPRPDAPAPAALPPRPAVDPAKAAADATIAKYGDLSGYYVVDTSGLPPGQPAQCSAAQTLVNLRGASQDKGDSFTFFLAQTSRLDGAGPKTSIVLASRTDGGRDGLTMRAYNLKMDPAAARETFDMLNIPIARPTAVTILEMPALAASIDGVRPTTYRQCRGK